ncbi:MAG: helix-turn-helix domain-containing protein, partial [Pseudomonadota bacterium]|nr:helix-turn-helix domain-containing protein [Pseudomonadota bacterium]
MTTTEQKRPRARNARPKIERAALKLFISEGVDAATTREIADVAGVSEGALYRHYKGKDELALALFMETHNRLAEMMQAAFSEPGTLDERVRRAVTAYCALADEDSIFAAVCGREYQKTRSCVSCLLVFASAFCRPGVEKERAAFVG